MICRPWVTVLLVDWGCQFGGHNALNAPNPIPMKQETARDVKGKGTVTQKARFHRHMKSLHCKGKSCVAGAEGGRARRRDRSSSSTSFAQLVMQFVVKDLTLIAWCSLLQLDRRPHDDRKDFKTCVGMRCWQVLKIAFSEWTLLWNNRICWKWHMDLMPLGRASMNWLHSLSKQQVGLQSQQLWPCPNKIRETWKGDVLRWYHAHTIAYDSIWYPTHPRSSWLWPAKLNS